MAKNFKLIFSSRDEEVIRKTAVDFLNQEIDIIYDKVIENTPEDTFSLEKDIKKSWISIRWNSIIASVYADENWPSREYQELVEYWSPSWQVYNYYKDGWRTKWGQPFKRWVGARMFTTAFINAQKKLKK